MRVLTVILILLAIGMIAFFAWALWPAGPVVFGKEDAALSPGDLQVNELMDTLHILELEKDDVEEVVATLMEFRSDSNASMAVLYIHGFGDYFFHSHLASWFNEREIDFYALDLRRYGRSLRPDSPPNYITDISIYFEEISKSVDLIKQEGYAQIILLGHSTGGLISTLYTASGPGRENLDALILNSPFFQFNVSAAGKAFLPIASFVGRVNPKKMLRGPGEPAYSFSLHEDHFGEWSYSTDWKPLEGFPVFAGWINAIHQAQKKVAAGMDLDIPVLVMHSDSTYQYAAGPKYVPAMQRMDAILNVDHIKARSAKLGTKVDVVSIPDAMHDIFLSAPPVRADAFQVMEDWMRQNL